ncbi:MAG: riboflavin synthase [Actinomycetota bacterium]|nr:riboflavin synthase [Actinomycetota bacterium]
MFTGIIEELGRVETADDGARIDVRAPVVSGDAEPGASIAVNGACLTVVERNGDVLSFDLAAETARRTTLGDLDDGDVVNLERPVTLMTRLGGHMVQGHVDGVGTVRAVDPAEGGSTMTIDIPPELARYVVEKGSIAVDGVSLTVAASRGDALEVALIPHTLAATTLGRRAPGDVVNIEVDILAKHVERILETR